MYYTAENLGNNQSLVLILIFIQQCSCTRIFSESTIQQLDPKGASEKFNTFIRIKVTNSFETDS